MHHKILLFLLLSLAFSSFAQNPTETIVKKSISIDYAYSNLDGLPQGVRSIYGAQHLWIYADTRYMILESRQERSPEEIAKMGKGMRATYVEEYATGTTFLCISIDTLNIKMDNPGGKGINLQQIFGPFQDPGFQIHTDVSTENICSYPCTGVKLDNSDAGSTVIMVTTAVKPALEMSRCPVFLTRDQYYGLVLGNNQNAGPIKLSLRATKIDIDQPKDVEKMLGAYRTVSQEEGNRLIGAMMSGK